MGLYNIKKLLHNNRNALWVGQGQVVQITCTHVSKCKMIKEKRKTMVSKLKSAHRIGENLYTSDKGSISRTYRELQKLNTPKKSVTQ
jgi:hypothetical protein